MKPEEKLRDCPECSRAFPYDLIHDLEEGTLGGPATFRAMCPLCARARINESCGLPRGTRPPKTAPIARRMYLRAEKWTER